MSHMQCITYRKKNSHLTYEERLKLEKLMIQNHQAPKENRVTKVRMAELMGISQATLCQELERGKVTQMTSAYNFYTRYSTVKAQSLVDFNATTQGRPLLLHFRLLSKLKKNP